MVNNNISKRESERVDGTWLKFFYKVVEPEFNDEVCAKYEKKVAGKYYDFFEKHLSPDKGKLLSLGAGFGQIEIPLARKGYKIIGIDNDPKIIELLIKNAEGYAMGNLEAKLGDLYEDFHLEWINQDIQACVSFGLLEHFTQKDLDVLIKKQFKISPLMICSMPINTAETLKAYKSTNPIGHVDENGIYRNLWTPDFWEKEIFKEYKTIDKKLTSTQARYGQVDSVIFAVKSEKK